MLRRTAALAAALALLPPAAALAGTGHYPVTQRPHSRVSVYTRDGVAVDTFGARVRTSHGHLVVTAGFTARRPGGHATVVLRVGACRPGDPLLLHCPPTVSRSWRVSRAPTSRDVIARIPLPASASDTILVTLTRPGHTFGPRYRQVHALLALHGDAWRGDASGDWFGAIVRRPRGIEVTNLTLDVAGLSDHEVRATERWAATADHAASVSWQCDGSGGCETPRHTALRPGAVTDVQRRPWLRSTSPTIGMTASVDDADLFSVSLPRPLR